MSSPIAPHPPEPDPGPSPAASERTAFEIDAELLHGCRRFPARLALTAANSLIATSLIGGAPGGATGPNSNLRPAEDHR